ncbi:uncharacterized protein LOC133928836 [Phragmites australis]|uniref:uncharacterized protein LOC133928836 n=1 Tax=Phragmites australis TaxID=29695 RepID=UPI002D77767E|nr:uncharacterized protein LOC133928836 [Phragmites australis]
MEVETMLEDDVFFAELSKRISLLITDDDETDFAAAAQFIPAATPIPGFASLAHVSRQQGASSMLAAPPAYTLFHHAASYGGGDTARAWQQQQQGGNKGTGVFIPRSTPGSAHNKKRGKNKGGSNAATNKAGSGALAAGAPGKKRA